MLLVTYANFLKKVKTIFIQFVEASLSAKVSEFSIELKIMSNESEKPIVQ